MVQLLPTKLLGIVTDHGDFPVERVVIDRAGEGRWVGSVGHEDVLKLTDLKDIFEDEDEDDAEGEAGEGSDTGNDRPDVTVPEPLEEEKKKAGDSDSDEPEQEDEPKPKKRKKKQIKDPLTKKREKKGKNQIVTDPSFFSGL